MLRIYLYVFINVCCLSCKSKKSAKEAILGDQNSWEFGDTLNLTFFPDNSYKLKLEHRSSNYDKLERYTGMYRLENDTLYFSESGFKYIQAKKAIIKNNAIEFLDGKQSLKITLLSSKIKKTNGVINTVYADYSLFTYHSNYSNYFEGKVVAYDLNLQDLIVVDSLLNSCMLKNSDKFTLKKSDYLKQCIAVKNERNEIEVYLNCACKDELVIKTHQFQWIAVDDGGDCYFQIKLNLTRGSYAQLSINGEA